jgi:hypothetical protein
MIFDSLFQGKQEIETILKVVYQKSSRQEWAVCSILWTVGKDFFNSLQWTFFNLFILGILLHDKYFVSWFYSLGSFTV